ncbi:MAG: hypothetical protein IKA05_07370 [Clostridia bacterium]|nr:hypothetical protein [Clostridia bacterium]
MKFRILVLLMEKLLGVSVTGDEPRADMYLPNKVLALGLMLGIAAIALAVAFLVTVSAVWIVLAALCAVLAVAAVLCWRNQTIQILDEETFEYTTFLGNKKVYSFSEIRSVCKNSDSATLFVGDGKVHIEAMAIMSDRLAEKLDNALKKQ